MVIIRVIASGKKNGIPAEALVEVIDYFDDSTGFTAMERGTGWSAAVVAEMMARGETIRGSGGVERMVPAKEYVQSLRLRGIKVTESVNFL
jgi:lysine 6-dehydrogenase